MEAKVFYNQHILSIILIRSHMSILKSSKLQKLHKHLLGNINVGQMFKIFINMYERGQILRV